MSVELHLRENLILGMRQLPGACTHFMERHAADFASAKGATHGSHQDWRGGYLDHVDEVFGIAALMYKSFSECRTLPFELQDAILVLWLHDLEKVFKQSPYQSSGYHKLALEDEHELKLQIAKECGITLTDEQLNALTYVHGEDAVGYVPGKRMTGPLGAFVHICDYWSARGWYDEPEKSGPLLLRKA